MKQTNKNDVNINKMQIIQKLIYLLLDMMILFLFIINFSIFIYFYFFNYYNKIFQLTFKYILN